MRLGSYENELEKTLSEKNCTRQVKQAKKALFKITAIEKIY